MEPVGVPEEWWPALLEAADAKIDAEMRRAEAIAQERRERLLEERAHRDRAAARRARQEAERIEREAEAAREAERAAERELLRQPSARAAPSRPPTTKLPRATPWALRRRPSKRATFGPSSGRRRD